MRPLFELAARLLPLGTMWQGKCSVVRPAPGQETLNLARRLFSRKPAGRPPYIRANTRSLCVSGTSAGHALLRLHPKPQCLLELLTSCACRPAGGPSSPRPGLQVVVALIAIVSARPFLSVIPTAIASPPWSPVSFQAHLLVRGLSRTPDPRPLTSSTCPL